jgi:PleD family two-component response regulator
MILAALDDLMFTSRIRAAAQGLGADVRFARTSTEALSLARQEKPALVLLDLNSTRADPMGILAQFKSDPGLEQVRVVGFVSHVQTDRIAAARAAGIDEVMARSAFVARLPDLLGDDR